MHLDKNIAVAVEFAEKVALARVRFKNAKLSQMDLDWHEARWKTFLQSTEVNNILDSLTDAVSLYWDIDQKLRSAPTDPELFLGRAKITRQISAIRHDLFLLMADVDTKNK